MKNHEFLNIMIDKMEITGLSFEKTTNPDVFTKGDYITLKMIMKVGEKYHTYDMYDWNNDEAHFHHV